MVKTTIHRIALFIACLCLLTVFSAQRAQADKSLADKIEAIVSAKADFGLFSGSIVVAENGKVIYSRSVGLANKEYDIPNSMQTRYNISSIEKCFMATLAMQLVQEGSISLNDPLTKYFPECPYSDADQIKIEHLLNHSSGLGEYRGSQEYAELAAVAKTIDDLLPLVFALEPSSPPGQHTRYSNAGVLLMKAIIEKVTGTNLKQALTTRIFGPLELDNTDLFVGGKVLKNRASAYRRSATPGQFVRVLSEPAAYTGGGIYTTAEDLLCFAQSFDSEKIIDATYHKIMTTPTGPDNTMGFGWFIIPFGGTRVVMHSGGSGGFASEMRRYPEKGYDLIVLSNCESGGFETTNDIEAALLGLPYSLATKIDLNYQLATGLQNGRQYRQALKFYEENITRGQPHMLSLYQAAKTRILGNFEPEKALEILDLYISLANANTQPSIAGAYWRKGMASEQARNRDLAIASYRKCLEYDATFSESRDALAKMGVIE